MDFAAIVPVLFMITLLGTLIFSLVNKKAVEVRADDPNVPKSTLAKDGPQGGCAFLKPLDVQQKERKPAAKPVLE